MADYICTDSGINWKRVIKKIAITSTVIVLASIFMARYPIVPVCLAIIVASAATLFSLFFCWYIYEDIVASRKMLSLKGPPRFF